jgi:glucokinase
VRILSGDIGATHSRFALYEAVPVPSDAAGPAAVPLKLLGDRVYKGSGYPSFNAVLQKLFTNDENGPALLDPARPPDAAVIAPAGPVEGLPGDECCRLANLPWHVRASDLRELLGTDRVRLINDLEAHAWACLMPEAIAARPALPGTARPGSPVAVVAAGTGFGKALLIRPGACMPSGIDISVDCAAGRREGLASLVQAAGCAARAPAGDPPSVAQAAERCERARVLPSEGGHAEFPFVGAREFEFAAFAAARLGTDRLICDHIVTGSGLTHILAFLGGPDVGPVEAAALCPRYPEVPEWYARFYGRLCRNYVLDTMAMGGVYIAGGMAMRVNVLESPAFAAEFHADSFSSGLLREVPVFLVGNPNAGLFGAAFFGIVHFGG